MSTQRSIERSIALWMAAEASAAPIDDTLDSILSATGRTRSAPRWLALLKEPPMQTRSRVAVGSATFRLAVLGAVVVALLIGAVAAVLAIQPRQLTDDWPVFLGGPDRTGVAGQGPTGRPTIRWTYQAGGSTIRNVAIVGQLVLTTSDDGILHALSRADGAERWRYSGTKSDVGVANGAVHATDAAGAVHAIDLETGRERWHSDPFSEPSGPTFGAGSLFMGTGDGELVALDLANGTVRWHTRVGAGGAVHNPAFRDGRVFAGADGAFVAVDAVSGALLWSVATGDELTGSARVGKGVAYIGASGDASTGHLRAVDAASGRELWNKPGLITSPTITDTVLYTGGDGILDARDASTGNELWHATFDGSVRGPVLAGNILYVPVDGERRVDAIDAATGGALWQFDIDGTTSGLAVAGGLVFVATDAGTVYAIGGDGSTIPVGPRPSTGPSSPPTPPPSSPTSASPAPSTGAAPSLTATVQWAREGPDRDLVPQHIVAAPDGRIWVSDLYRDRFAVFTPDGTFVEYWGTTGSGEGEFDFRNPNGDVAGGIAFASDGSIFVLEAGNQRVQRFDKNRTFVKAWGTFGDAAGQFKGPIGLAMGPDDTLFVLDEIRAVVEHFGLDGHVIGSFDPFNAHRSGSNTTSGITVDAGGNVYVGFIEPSVTVRFAPDGEPSQEYGVSGSGDAVFAEQTGYLSVDSAGRLFVSQGPRRGEHPAVLVFAPDGAYLGGWGDAGAGSGEIGFPTGVLVDADGNVYVGDAAGSPEFPGIHRIQKFSVTFEP